MNKTGMYTKVKDAHGKFYQSKVFIKGQWYMLRKSFKTATLAIQYSERFLAKIAK